LILTNDKSRTHSICCCADGLTSVKISERRVGRNKKESQNTTPTQDEERKAGARGPTAGLDRVPHASAKLMRGSACSRTDASLSSFFLYLCTGSRLDCTYCHHH